MYYFWLIFIIFIAFSGLIGIFFLWVSQLSYLYNDASYLDKFKLNKKIENYYCFIEVDNEKNDVCRLFI